MQRGDVFWCTADCGWITGGCRCFVRSRMHACVSDRTVMA
jgi:acyl-coenzyme A synthetase/AMP-(fatty) acid ligase